MGKERKEQLQETEEKAMENVVVRNKSRKKALLLTGIGVVLILTAAILIGVRTFGGSGRKLQEQLELGARYLEEMDYEHALAAFNAALSIDPKNADAYLGLVEVYIRTNDFESALKDAKEGYETTGDERLKEKIDMIESGNIFASNGWNMKMSGYDEKGNLVFWHEYAYNLKGQRRSVAKYNAQGVQEQYLELTYDEEGRELISYSYENDGNLFKCITEYDGSNYRRTYYTDIGDTVWWYTEAEADDRGRIWKETEYDEDGSLKQAIICEYDESGNEIKRSYYDKNNELTNYYIWIRDENGRSIQDQFYNGNDEFTGYREYVYDDDGRYIGSREYDADGVLLSEQVMR